jgi:hypothetical protein
MLDKGKELDWFNSGEIILLTVIAAVGLIYFIIWEKGKTIPSLIYLCSKDEIFRGCRCYFCWLWPVFRQPRYYAAVVANAIIVHRD